MNQIVLMQLVHPLLTEEIQIAKTVQAVNIKKGPQVEVWFEIAGKRHAGSWLSRLPLTRNEKCKTVARTQIGVPICITRSNGRLRW